jgi:hypothetical protein
MSTVHNGGTELMERLLQVTLSSYLASYTGKGTAQW